MKSKRISILLKIDDLDKQRCRNCIDKGAKGVHCACAAAKKIRKYGFQLAELTKPRNVEEYKLLKVLKLKDMTRDHYWQFVAAEFSDKSIRESLGVGETTFTRWKNENGLVIKRSVGV